MPKSNKLSKIVNMPLSKLMSLSRADLLTATNALVRESNKRLTVMKKKGLKSPSTEYIKKHGGRFRTTTRRGGEKSVKELRAEFQRAKGFLESKTSTVKGYREWEKGVAATLLDVTTDYAMDTAGNIMLDSNGKPIVLKAGIDYYSLTETQKRRFWQAFAKIEELDKANTFKGSANYKATVKEIFVAVKNGLLKREIDAFADLVNWERYNENEKDFEGTLKLGRANSPFKNKK